MGLKGLKFLSEIAHPQKFIYFDPLIREIKFRESFFPKVIAILLYPLPKI